MYICTYVLSAWSRIIGRERDHYPTGLADYPSHWDDGCRSDTLMQKQIHTKTNTSTHYPTIILVLVGPTRLGWEFYPVIILSALSICYVYQSAHRDHMHVLVCSDVYSCVLMCADVYCCVPMCTDVY